MKKTKHLLMLFAIACFIQAKAQEASVIPQSFDNVAKSTSDSLSSIATKNKEEQSQILNEVFVTGLGQATKQKQMAISAQSIKASSLVSTPNASIDQALVGLVAGAQISSSSGDPSEKVNIQLRGANTLNRGSEPMILIDGVQMGTTSLNTIDPSMIDRIEIVKGAAAATLYGAQGSNGVIQVFTKRGNRGAKSVGRISFSTGYTSSNILNNGGIAQPKYHSWATNLAGNIIDGSDKEIAQNEVTGMWSEPKANTTGTLDNLYNGTTKFYDHIGQLFKTASSFNMSLNATGGSEKSDYAFGISRNRSESVLKGAFERINFTTNLGAELFKNFIVRSVIQMAISDNNMGTRGISQNITNSDGGTDALRNALYTLPLIDLNTKNKAGQPIYKFGPISNATNPMYNYNYVHYNRNILDIIPSININYKPLSFLEFDYKYTLNYKRDAYVEKTDNQTLNVTAVDLGWNVAQGINGGYREYYQNNKFQNSIFTTNINLDFKEHLKLDIPLTTSTTFAYDWRRSQLDLTILNYQNIPLFSSNQNQASNKGISSYYEEDFITFGYLFNQKLDYSDIAGVSGGFRYDYSSAFGDSKDGFFFPRGDAYFNIASLPISDEFKNFIPYFKLRTAYGQAGIQPLPYDRISSYNVTQTNSGNIFSSASILSNPNLKVERSAEFELGTDLTINLLQKSDWFQKIDLNATYWTKNSTDVIFNVPIPITSGSSFLTTNAIDLSAKGFEFKMDLNVFNNSTFKWNFSTLYTNFSTMVDKINASTKSLPSTTNGNGATYILQAGEQLNTLYGYKVLRTVNDQDSKGEYYISRADVSKYEVVNGMVVDTSSKKVQISSEKSLLGNTTPKGIFTFINNFTYKNFLALNVQIDWIYRAKMYNQTKQWLYFEKEHVDFDKQNTINGKTARFENFYTSLFNGNQTLDYFLEDASFVRLRNISVSCDFAKIYNIPKIEKLQLVFSGRNLFTFTNYTGFDPEANQNNANSASTTSTGSQQTTFQKGMDMWSFPNLKSYQISLNITFKN